MPADPNPTNSSPQFWQFEVGPMKNFVYFLGATGANEVLVVDPGWDADTIRGRASDLGKTIVGAVCTHSHYDHVNAVEALLETHDIPVYMLDREIEFSGFSSENIKPLTAGDRIENLGYPIEILHTPGHTIGSISLKFGSSKMGFSLVTGDTLFVNGCGRCDMPSGDPSQMYDTLKKLCRELDPHTMILPGHDYGPVKTDSIASQLKTNPYLKVSQLDDFLDTRMRPRR